ncbi:unnamed protein product [Spirodela intermedia]|uniref:Uncharacterized protein n=1 Tax=Spirodela intermedia TaxID=51605 RepID=A0A7I8JKL9_SPIIN|nr:unnamed protein product [Spirodela intermedia]CAA6670714.1 unnamed protein product [Spirodela intermedia]
MEWKPKLTTQVPAQASATTMTHDVSTVTVETDSPAAPLANSRNPKESTSNLQKKLEELHFSESQHVIIPDHLQFGSFDASFGLETRSTLPNGADSERSSMLLTESSQGLKKTTQNVSSSAQQEHPVHSQAPSQMPENLPSKEADAPLDVPAMPEHEQLKQATALAQGSAQISPLHTSPLYSAFGLVPPVLGGQFAPFEGSEAQAREPSAVASFIVQQPFDPSTNYYTQIYQPGADGDGRFSPYLAPGGTTKYNGNTAILSPQTGQSAQEQTASSPMLPATGITNQAGGAVQTSVAIAQQHLPAYRQPAGVHMPQYPPNYMPYGHYFSPFYVPTPPIHPFFSSTAFPQQPLASSLYPPPAAAATATPVKYSQYKSGTGGSNPSHSAVPSSNGPPVVNDDPSATQYKDNNVYISGQQSEGGTVWIPSPGRDLPGLQAGSFYNLPPGSTCHSQLLSQETTPLLGSTILATAVTVSGSGGAEMAPPPAGVYQQPQRAQMNWAGNY